MQKVNLRKSCGQLCVGGMELLRKAAAGDSDFTTERDPGAGDQAGIGDIF